MSPRIAIVTNFPSYHQVDLFNTLEQINQVDFRVFYLRTITPDRQWKTLKTIKHSHHFCTEFRLTNGIYFNPNFRQTLQDYNPDLLVITQYASIAMQLAMLEWGIRRKRWIFWSETPGVKWSETPVVKNDFLRRCLRHVALLPLNLYPSEVWGIGNRAVEKYRQYTDVKVYNIPYFFDTAPFYCLQSQGEDNSRIKLLFAGKFNYRKGFDVLLEAVINLSHIRHDFVLRLVGDGPLRNMIETLPSYTRGHLEWCGFAELEDMPHHYNWADIVLFPSRYDGWGMGVLEGMVARRVVIATSSTGSALDAIVDGVNGFVVPPEDAPNLQKSIEWLLDNPQCINSIGQAACLTALHYDATEGANKINRSFIRILEQN